jgi:hypothetical protein
MENDAVHVKAQAEARYYLECKRVEREDRLLTRVIYGGVLLWAALILVLGVG